MERGIDFEKERYPFKVIIDKVAALSWKHFFNNPDGTVMSRVQELYADVLNDINNQAIVKGMLVLFSQYNINSFYGLRDIGQGE